VGQLTKHAVATPEIVTEVYGIFMHKRQPLIFVFLLLCANLIFFLNKFVQEVHERLFVEGLIELHAD
jgi:hypothetical protein